MLETVNAYASIFGWLGYNVHARNFFGALDRYVRVCLIPKYPNFHGFPLTTDLRRMMGRRKTMKLSSPAVCLSHGNEMHSFTGSRMVGYTVFETDRVAPDWINLLNQLDQVWTASHWGVNVLVESGVSEKRVRCVPEGVDTTVFRPKPVVRKRKEPDVFRFLSVGKFEPRKGQAELLRAYAEEFGPDEPVRLSLLAHNPHHADFEPHREIEKLALPPHPPIECLAPRLTAHDLANLYNLCDAFVLPTKGEGWGLPVIEAMACGLPAIVTNHSGVTEYANDVNAYMIGIDGMEEASDPIFHPHSGTHGRWARPSFTELKRLMRHVVTHRAEAEERGARAAADMKDKWSWDCAARAAFDLLRELCEQ